MEWIRYWNLCQDMQLMTDMQTKMCVVHAGRWVLQEFPNLTEYSEYETGPVRFLMSWNIAKCSVRSQQMFFWLQYLTFLITSIYGWFQKHPYILIPSWDPPAFMTTEKDRKKIFVLKINSEKFGKKTGGFNPHFEKKTSTKYFLELLKVFQFS